MTGRRMPIEQRIAANMEAAQHFPPTAGAMPDFGSMTREVTAAEKFESPKTRRCDCRAVFKTKLVNETQCPDCRARAAE